ncbi:MAG: ribonuclease HII [Pseudomonadota bacterium]
MPESPTLILEDKLWQQGQLRIVGVDEVGRGCLSGPVLAAAVLIPPDCQMLEGVADSKKVSRAQREALYPQILAQALSVAIGAVSVADIDRINIRNASYLAMQRALQRVGQYDHALIDGQDNPHIELGPHTAVIGGDRKSYAVACASIIAKVVRDRAMQQLAMRYPGYGWESNAGYGVKAHLQALETLGITPLHRRSYAPVKKLMKAS